MREVIIGAGHELSPRIAWPPRVSGSKWETGGPRGWRVLLTCPPLTSVPLSASPRPIAINGLRPSPLILPSDSPLRSFSPPTPSAPSALPPCAQGYPGTLHVQVTYTLLRHSNELHTSIVATTDEATPGERLTRGQGGRTMGGGGGKQRGRTGGCMSESGPGASFGKGLSTVCARALSRGWP